MIVSSSIHLLENYFCPIFKGEKNQELERLHSIPTIIQTGLGSKLKLIDTKADGLAIMHIEF